MLRLLVWLLMAYVGYRVVKALMASKQSGSTTQQVRTGEETVQDPVCGMYVAKADAVVGKLDSERYYFCSLACLEKFRVQLDHASHPKNSEESP